MRAATTTIGNEADVSGMVVAEESTGHNWKTYIRWLRFVVSQVRKSGPGEPELIGGTSISGTRATRQRNSD